MFLDRLGKYWPETLSIIRIHRRLMFLEHGSSKLLGFPHPAMAMPAMGSLLWVQGIFELVGGALIAIGLFTRPVAFVLAGDIGGRIFHRPRAQGFIPAAERGRRRDLVLCFIFLLFFVAGPGRWSVDRNPQ